MLSFFPQGVLDEILNLIESVSEDFPSYSSIMGNCYAAVHIADDHMHTDITCNIEEPHPNYRIGMDSNRKLVGNLVK